MTKVVYLPDPKFQELAIAGVETLVSTRTDPGTDPVEQAERYGTILAVLRLGNRVRVAAAMSLLDAKAETEQALESRILNGSGILFFHSESCPVCARVAPDFTREMSRIGLPSLHMDVQKNPRIAKRFRVSSTPTFVWVSCEVEIERAIGAEFQQLVDKFAAYWEEMGGARSGLGFNGGLKEFLTQQLAEAQRSRELVLTDVISLELAIADLGGPIEISKDLPEENRKQIE